MSNSKLYVGNLPYEVGETDLQQLFAEAGAVESVNVMRDMATGRARGFAFIEMATDEDAGKAIAKFNDYQMGLRHKLVPLNILTLDGKINDHAAAGRREDCEH